ncbi:uncharacterized protein LOC116289675 [Actinia tenebrosa]|uniref:Uncharacterized protein LOC116289675 n=1 Tax=Actinia tenebrosa TaxID=6105 RepID=A0A6P8HIL1_ACTTE|nr:uncharacterized protein LOC116289675 [Actinia tenebrosa]
MSSIEAGHGKSAGIVGIIILLFALADMIAGIIWVTYGGKDASGIWVGLLLLITGILGIVSWVKLNKAAMVFFLVFCIIDIICTIVQAVIAALGFLIWQILKAVIASQCTIKNGKCDCGDKDIPMDLEDCSWISDIEAIFLTLLIANGLCMIVVFAGSIIGCMATCCAKGPQQTGVVVVQHPGVVVTTTHGQAPPGYGEQPGQYPMTDVPPKH